MEQVTDVPRFLFALGAMIVIVFVAQVGYASRELWIEYARDVYQSLQRRLGRPTPLVTHPPVPSQQQRRPVPSRSNLFRKEETPAARQAAQLGAILAQPTEAETAPKVAPKTDGRADGRTDGRTDGAFQRDIHFDQLQLDRTKEAVIRVLLLSGWSVEEIRSVVKGSNETIGALVKEARESLELPAPIKVTPVQAPAKPTEKSSSAKVNEPKAPDPIVALLPDPASDNPEHLVPLRQAPDGSTYISGSKSI